MMNGGEDGDGDESEANARDAGGSDGYCLLAPFISPDGSCPKNPDMVDIRTTGENSRGTETFYIDFVTQIVRL